MHPLATKKSNRGCMILELSEMSNSPMNGLKILDRAPFVCVASIGMRLYTGVVPPFFVKQSMMEQLHTVN